MQTIAIIGSEGCGKTRLINYLNTFKSLFSFLELSPEDAIPESVKGAVVLFSLTSRKSFSSSQDVLIKLEADGKSFPVLLAGNKTDLPKQRHVSAVHSFRLAKHCETTFQSLRRVRPMEVCAKNGFHTPKVVEFFTTEVINGERYADPMIVSSLHA